MVIKLVVVVVVVVGGDEQIKKKVFRGEWWRVPNFV